MPLVAAESQVASTAEKTLLLVHIETKLLNYPVSRKQAMSCMVPKHTPRSILVHHHHPRTATRLLVTNKILSSVSKDV